MIDLNDKENIIKCSACGEISDRKLWKEPKVEIVNDKREFVGGCPHCKGEYYEEIGDVNVRNICVD